MSNAAKALRHMTPQELGREVLTNRTTPGPGGCLVYTGRLDSDGYGEVKSDWHLGMAHRLTYEAVKGDIPPGLTLDHLCRNRACVNPEHLEPVSQGENTLRSALTINSINAAKTHCKSGHKFTPENTYVYLDAGSPRRTCRACQRAAVARYKARLADRRSA